MSTVQAVTVTTDTVCALATSRLIVGRGRHPLLLTDWSTPVRSVIQEAERVAVALNVELYVDGVCERTTL